MEENKIFNSHSSKISVYFKINFLKIIKKERERKISIIFRKIMPVVLFFP